MLNLPPYPMNEGPQWTGYTYEEMQMRRTMVQAQMEIQKFKLAARLDSYRRRAPLIGGSSSLFSRLAGAFSMAEYAFFAIRLVKMAAPLFRKKK